MIRIAICDDEIRAVNRIKELTVALMENRNIEYEIETYTNGNELLSASLSYDIILLDIEMDEISGMEVAHKLRAYNKDTKIIFITNSTSYLREGYTVRAERYFVKPVDKIEFNYEMKEVLADLIVDNKFILDKRISEYKIYLNDILFIEFNNRKTIIHKISGNLETLLSLKEWNEMLKEYHFSQCHKAYIINLKHISEFKSDYVTINNNIELPIGRKYKNQLKEDYFKLIGERI